MYTIEELSKINIAKAEQIRRELGVNQAFLCTCLGVSNTTWSYWVNKSKEIPQKHKKTVVETFYALKLIKEGYKMVPGEGQEVENVFEIKMKQTISLLQAIEAIAEADGQEAISVLVKRVKTLIKDS